MTNDALIAALSHLVSDAGNPETRNIDQLPTLKIAESSNQKLLARAVRIVMQATDCERAEAEALLEQTHNNTKVAILMSLTELNYQQAMEKLAESDAFLRRSMEKGESH